MNSHSPRSADPAPPLSLQRPTRPARILVLDDEDWLKEMLNLILRKFFRDYTVTETSTGEEAWQEIQRDAPDLIITDYAHHGAPLEETFALLAKHPIKFPIILTSGYLPTRPDLQQGLFAHPSLNITFFPKPYTEGQMRTAILAQLLPDYPPQAPPFS